MATGMIEGALVSQLLTSLLDVYRKYGDSKESLRVLQDRLLYLKPLVDTVAKEKLGEVHAQAANEWVRKLNQVLEDARDLESKSRGSIHRMLHAGDLEQINGRLNVLSTDSSAIQLLGQIDIRREIKESLKFHVSNAREGEIKRLVGQLHKSRSDIGDGSSSSNPSIWKPHWDRGLDVPDPPRIVFGDAVADKQIEDILYGQYKKWIVMWGMGGVGKTCTALRLFHNPSIQEHFTGGSYWITVSKDQAPPQQILKQLYEKIKLKEGWGPSERCSSDFPDSLHLARLKVKNLLDRDKVLLLLDDVWDSETLRGLDVISEDKLGVILTTTRNKGILKFVTEDAGHLRSVVDYAKVVEIPRLSRENGWQLFSWHAFDVYGKPVPDELEDVAEAVADECKGLPLALKVIASTVGAIRLLDVDMRLGRTLEGEWRKALDELRRGSAQGTWKSVIEHRTGSPDVDEDASLYDRLQWSLDNLVEHPCLKDCFYYFAAYPEDFDVIVEDLLRLWVAEGLCSAGQGVELLGILIAKAVVELSDDGKKCRIHDVMRDLLRLNVKYDAGGEIPVPMRKYLYEPGLNWEVLPDGWAGPDVQCTAKGLSMRNNDLRELPHEFNAPALTALMLAQNFHIASLPPKFFQSLSKLRVLDLSHTGIEEVSGKVLRNLKSLVFLDLRDCSLLRRISDELNSLEDLEVLLLSGSLSLQKVPRMKGLTKLHTLSIELPRIYPRYGTRDVLELRSLRRLDIKGGGWKYCPKMSSLSVLEELSVASFQQFPEGLLELRCLKSLDLTGIGKGSYLKTLPCLGMLPELEELTMIRCCIESFPGSFFGKGTFRSLRKLKFRNVACKRLFTFHAGAMPRIEMLQLAIQAEGDEIPFSIVTLTTLKYLFLSHGTIDTTRALFSQPRCFPNLERLVSSSELPELPPHLLQRQKQRRLEIEKLDSELW